jgi:deoxyguanosine kinase
VLMQRIASRDRPYERNMEWDYIDQLSQAYDVFFTHPHQYGNHFDSPTLVLDTNSLDYIRCPEDLSLVETRIRQALKIAPFQPELPLDASHANYSSSPP